MNIIDDIFNFNVFFRLIIEEEIIDLTAKVKTLSSASESQQGIYEFSASVSKNRFLILPHSMTIKSLLHAKLPTSSKSFLIFYALCDACER